MLVKFIPTKKAETRIDAVLAYIFQPKDASGLPRPVVKHVAGAMPEVLSLLALSIPSKTPYTHSVLAFSDSDMARTTESERLQILESYLNELAAGLGDKKRMPYLAVSHGDHFHIVTLRWDVRSEKVYQPYVVTRGDTARFNSWKDVVNARYGLDSPTEGEAYFRLDGKHVPEGVRALVRALNTAGSEMLAGAVNHEPAVIVQAVEPVVQTHGYEVARLTRSGFSVTGPEMKRNIRIKFTNRLLGKDREVEDEVDVRELEAKLANHRVKLMAHMGRYHFRNSTFQGYFMDKKRENPVHPFSAMSFQ